MIPLYYFQHTEDFFRVAWATDPEGSILPDKGSWNLQYPMPINPSVTDPFIRSALDGLKRDGYFVCDLMKKKH
jgi:hypothetical protein